METASQSPSQPPLIAHVILHLGVGGMENGLVNLINNMSPERYRHAIICLRGVTEYRNRLRNHDVDVIALNKKEGTDWSLYVKLWKALRDMRPAIVHTRNLSALEGQFVAKFAGVSAQVHGEHGRDVFDLYGTNSKYNLLRRLARPCVDQYIAVSKDLETWLADKVRVNHRKISQIYNGVDSVKFRPRTGVRVNVGPESFMNDHTFVIGSVGRMAAVKDYPSLVKAFLRLLDIFPEQRDHIRLMIVGDGPARQECESLLKAHHIESLVWITGERNDIPELLRSMDVFVLPSLGEGISNTILEAMATGLPVIATNVGGNPELVEPNETGLLVPPNNPNLMADGIQSYIADPGKAQAHGRAAREKVEAQFSMEAMVQGYLNVYDQVLNGYPKKDFLIENRSELRSEVE